MATVEGKREVIKKLRRLVLSVVGRVNNGLSRGVLQPENEVYGCPKIKEFKYTDKGVVRAFWETTYTTKKSWFVAVSRITKLAKKSAEYSEALELLTKMLGEKFRASLYLEYFIRKLALQRLEGANLDENDINKFLTIFLKDLNEEPLKYGACVELEGIAMQPKKNGFAISDITILLKQTEIEDLEKEYPVYRHASKSFPSLPSAILNIEFFGRQADRIDMEVNQAIAILRLFKVASVKYILYTRYSESIIDVGASGTLTNLGPEKALEKSQITNEEMQKLKEFWQRMRVALPTNIYDHRETRVDHISIAYKRYCDALLQNGVIERGIANCVMGLESLFLKGNEMQELSYRLKMRVAKILSFLQYEPTKVKSVVKDAYDIRSRFVHGDYLSNKEKNKFNREYGDMHPLLLSLMNYLRISIITMIFTETFSKKKKEKLLDLIDDALIDKDKDKQLNNLLTVAGSSIPSKDAL